MSKIKENESSPGYTPLQKAVAIVKSEFITLKENDATEDDINEWRQSVRNRFTPYSFIILENVRRDLLSETGDLRGKCA
jgi:hypothetical protein